jgi:hypothetical protein
MSCGSHTEAIADALEKLGFLHHHAMERCFLLLKKQPGDRKNIV